MINWEIDTSLLYPKGLRYLTSEAMEIYADQQLAEFKEKLKSEIDKIKNYQWNVSKTLHPERFKDLIDKL